MANYSESYQFPDETEIREFNTVTDCFVSPALNNIKELNNYIKQTWFNNSYENVERKYDFTEKETLKYKKWVCHYMLWLINAKFITTLKKWNNDIDKKRKEINFSWLLFDDEDYLIYYEFLSFIYKKWYFNIPPKLEKKLYYIFN